MPGYKSPTAFRQAIQSCARNEARARGGSPVNLVDLFYLSRLLTRVFQHDPNGWMLKGGQALLARWPKARYSRDIDLLALRTHDELDAAVAHLIAAAHTDLDDFIRFEHHSTSEERQGQDARKVKFHTFCGAKDVGVISVDVVTNLKPLGQPVERELRPPFPMDLDSKPATVHMWPLEDHVADKVAAMYERHAGGVSSRYKDLVDLVIIATSETLDGRITHRALHREVDRRTTAGVDLTLPTTFTIPDRTSWEPGYNAEAAKAPHLGRQYRTLGQTEDLAARFISPLLAEQPLGTWHPAETRWA